MLSETKVGFLVCRSRVGGTLQKVIMNAIIRGEPERAPNTRDTGSGFICIYLYKYICMFVG